MSEILEQNSSELPPQIPRETREVMEARFAEAQRREHDKTQVTLSTDGITKDASELFEQVRNTYKMDTESGQHMESGMPMPIAAKDNNQKIDLMNKLIDQGSGDGNGMIQMLRKNIKKPNLN
jgi:hypothetical protein